MEKKQEKELTKDEANVCRERITFTSYDGAQIPDDAIVKIQDYAGKKIKNHIHTKSIY